MSIERMSFSYPAEMKKEVMKIAKLEKRSLSAVVQIFIEEGIERRKQHGLVPSPDGKLRRRKKKVAKA